MYRPMADQVYIDIMLPILVTFIIIGIIGCIMFTVVAIIDKKKD